MPEVEQRTLNWTFLFRPAEETVYLYNSFQKHKSYLFHWGLSFHNFTFVYACKLLQTCDYSSKFRFSLNMK